MESKALKKNTLQNTSHKSHTIIKSRDLNEAHFPNFGINEYKLFSLILSKAIRVDQNNQKEFIKVFCETHIVTPKEFSEIFDVQINHCYKILKDSVDTLTNKKIIVKSSTGEAHMPICSFAKYNSEKHYLEIRLSHEIIPYLDVSVKFVKTKLYQIAKFKSLYSIRLYELVMSFRSLGKCSISVERLRFLLGVDEDKLKEYKNFKQKVLTPSINEVNKICSFGINSIEAKEYRKVVKIDLTCKKSKAKKLDVNSTSNKTQLITHEEDVRIRLVKLGVEKKVVNKYSKYSDEKLNIAYEKLVNQIKTGRVKNPTAYFVSLMNKGL